MTVRKTQWAEDVEKEPIRWAIPDYIPRRVVSSIYGPRNCGKTMAAVWLTAEASKGATGTKLRVWMNSQEDDLPTVLRPRLDAAGADMNRQVRLTAEHWRLPADLKAIESGLRDHRAGGAPDDMLILDSVQQHITRPYAFAPSEQTIKGLLDLAVAYDIAVVLIGHTTKGKHASVEAMIAGSAVLQNLSKAIYVFGPEPGSAIRDLMHEADGQDTGNPCYVLACERIGIAQKPVSMLFEQLTVHDAVTRRDEPYLTYAGPSEFTARDVLDEAKSDDRGGRDAGKTARAAYWMREVLANGPMPTKDFEDLAKADGVYGSRNTFDRARKIAGVRSYKVGNVWWVALKEHEPAADDEASPPTPPTDDTGDHGGDDPRRAGTGGLGRPRTSTPAGSRSAASVDPGVGQRHPELLAGNMARPRSPAWPGGLVA